MSRLPPVSIDTAELSYLATHTRPPGLPLPQGMSHASVQGRSWDEHLASAAGPALDPLHLFLRSGLPPRALRNEVEACAAILKALHDVMSWSPMNSGSLDTMLREDLWRLTTHSPDDPQLRDAWNIAVAKVREVMPQRLAA